MLKKKIPAMLLISIMTVNLFSTTVLAANTSDRAFEFSVNMNTKTRITESRAKENTTSTYLNLTQVPTTYIYCDVEGYCPAPNGGVNSWINKNVGGKSVTVPIGQWFIRQTVYESGGRSARLKFTRYATDGRIKGKWSPDSVGSYPIVN